MSTVIVLQSNFFGVIMAERKMLMFTSLLRERFMSCSDYEKH